MNVGTVMTVNALIHGEYAHTKFGVVQQGIVLADEITSQLDDVELFQASEGVGAVDNEAKVRVRGVVVQLREGGE